MSDKNSNITNTNKTMDIYLELVENPLGEFKYILFMPR